MKKNSGWGGLRRGAGRPQGSGHYQEATVVMRVPKSKASKLKAWLNNQQPSEYSENFHTISSDSLSANTGAYPLYTTRVAAGFPSPADAHIDQCLNLHDYVVHRPAATFFVRVQGDSMIGAGIHENDILVVDRSLEPSHGKVVIAVVNGELTVKRLQKQNGGLWLAPENPRYPLIPISEDTAFHIWGVVTNVIHAL